MSAYVIATTNAVLDEAAALRYSELARPSVLAHNGVYLARTADFEVQEARGSAPVRIVVVEFSSLAAAKAWYGSPEYAPAREIAEAALDRQLLFVESV